MAYKHFSIHALCDGIYAAVHQDGGAAYSNAGIINLGERTLVFDTFDSVSAGRELLQASEDLTGRNPFWVVNSHKHGDHWTGNQVFADQAVIIATHQTCTGMLDWGAEIESMKSNPQQIKNAIRDLEASLKSETNPRKRQGIERSLKRNSYLLGDLPDFRFCPPTMTFSEKLIFKGTKMNVELVCLGPTHTTEECYLFCDNERIIFTGDLCFFACPPFLPEDCSMEGWLQFLDSLGGMNFSYYIPGHGPIGGKQDLKKQVGYMLYMQELVSEHVENGYKLKDILKLPEPIPFQDWGSFPQRHENNLRTLFYLKKKRKVI